MSTAPVQVEPESAGMEIHINKSELLKEVSVTQGVVERKTTVPILSSFLFEAAGNSLLITATDLELSLRTACAARVITPGSCTIPARKLFEYIRLLGDSEIVLKSLPNDWVQIRSGRSHTKMVGLPRKNFPSLPLFPAASAITLPKDALRTMIARTIFAISQEESRYTLNGALLILQPDSMTMVATDGHRLAHIKMTAKTPVTTETRVLIPRKALAETYSLLGSDADVFQFARDDSSLFFRIGNRLLTSRQLAGVFPNYQAVMPRELPYELSLPSDELSLAIQRVAQFSDTSNKVLLSADKNELRLSCSNTEMGESEETLATTYSGAPIKIGFNSAYLLDFLRAIETEKVNLRVKDPHGAAELTPASSTDNEYRYICMPVRV